jgi:uncharacterized YigZ family protein
LTDGAPGDSHLSVEDGPEVEAKVRGSRFLGQVFRAGDESAADARLDAVRRTHHAATHHCWARRLGGHGPVSDRYDDDGEPSGTAGAPMLAVLAGAELRDVLVVVTRYYGGTKLGTGGLARAYADAARMALQAAPRRTVWHEATVRVTCAYEDMGAVEAVLAREGSRIRRVGRDFTGSPVFRVTVLRSFAPRLTGLVREATAGRARTEADGAP